MSNVTTSMIKELRERSGAGMMDCKAALLETDGDMDKAMEVLIKKSASIAANKGHRSTANGMIKSYIHTRQDGGVGTLGVMVEVNIETDFAARLPVFNEFVDKLCLHIAAAGPEYVNDEEIPSEQVEKQREMFVAQMEDSGKPENIVANIVEGKLKKWKEEITLMNQIYSLPATKEEAIPIRDMMQQTIGKIGENIVIKRFARFELGV